VVSSFPHPPEGIDPDDDDPQLCDLDIETQESGRVRSLKGLTQGQADAVCCFASALASDLLDVSALKFLAGIVEGSRDD
jgi:hypothetical protein